MTIEPLLVDELTSAEDWRESALCAQTDPALFFPDKGGSALEAKRLCATCPVRIECIESALANEERHGIWGGLSDRELRRIRRARATSRRDPADRKPEPTDAPAVGPVVAASGSPKSSTTEGTAA